MSKKVFYFYSVGSRAGLTEVNPYSACSESLKHHAWECGFVDRYGRSSNLA